MSVTGDTATAGADFAAVAPVTLTIAAGQTTGTASFTLTPVDDAVDEADETLAVSGVTAAPELPVTPATLTLGDDDERGVTVKPTLLRLRAGEHKSYTVRLSSQPTETATVRVIVPPDRRRRSHGRACHADVHSGDVADTADRHGNGGRGQRRGRERHAAGAEARGERRGLRPIARTAGGGEHHRRRDGRRPAGRRPAGRRAAG